MTPTDSDAQDELLAKVTPLRRRPSDGADEDHEPLHARDDLEPPDGYSVWEQPTSELIRRAPTDHEDTAAMPPSRATRRPLRRLVPALAVAVAVGGGALALTNEPRHPRGTTPSRPQGATSTQARTNAGGARAAHRASPRSADVRGARARRNRRHSSEPAARLVASATAQPVITPATAASPPVVEPARDRVTAGPASGCAPGASGGCAVREFGFEQR
jgi:hypothetical protein